MLANGTVRCWGQGTFGQQGNNSTSDSTVTVQVSGLTDAAALSVGSANASGHLGTSTTGGAFSVPQATAGCTAYWK